jgi:uncharacterized protein (DUF362 family)
MSEQRYQVFIQHDRPVPDIIHSALEDLEALKQLIPVGKRILIKPNLVVAKTNDIRAITNPQIIELLLD